jgi:hypothetical protein
MVHGARSLCVCVCVCVSVWLYVCGECMSMSSRSNYVGREINSRLTEY